MNGLLSPPDIKGLNLWRRFFFFFKNFIGIILGTVYFAFKEAVYKYVFENLKHINWFEIIKNDAPFMLTPNYFTLLDFPNLHSRHHELQ